MTDLLIVGSIAFDGVKTPFGEDERALGGAAVYASVAASFFTDPAIVGVVGDDYPDDALATLGNLGIDIAGVERAPGQTFFWKARYDDINEAVTEETRLGVFAEFRPKIPAQHADARFLFLANIDPELQLHVLDQVQPGAFVGLDTMNFWIESKREALGEVISRVQLLLVNDAEARMLTGEQSLARAGRKLLELGPDHVMIKKGEHGALSFSAHGLFCAAAHPAVEVRDPTGAGDTFAGGLMGCLARAGAADPDSMRRAVMVGTVMASFNVEDFSFRRMLSLGRDEIRDRYRQLLTMTRCSDMDWD